MLYAIAAVLVLVLDQGLKYFVTLKIALNEGVMRLIPGVISLVNIHNSGAAFGMLGGGAMRWGFVILAVGFTGAVVWALAARKLRSPLIRWLLVLIAAGGIGNAIDRALFGYVVDMFHFDLSFLRWFAVFNVADIFITVPGILLCFAIFFSKEEEPKEEKAPAKVVLHSRKKEPDPELKARRDAGKLYDDPAPFDQADPFREFQRPAPRPEAAERAPAPAESAPAPQAVAPAVPKSQLSVEQQLSGLTVDDILKELQ